MSDTAKAQRPRRFARTPKIDASPSSADTSAPRSSASSTTDAATPPKPPSKIAQVIALLKREDGATLAELMAATGWQPHTTRAALTGLRKKGHAGGVSLTRTRLHFADVGL